MATHYTNGDRILQAVLADPKLAELGEYIPTGDYCRCSRFRKYHNTSCCDDY